jgi:hypothetical protein
MKPTFEKALPWWKIMRNESLMSNFDPIKIKIKK